MTLAHGTRRPLTHCGTYRVRWFTSGQRLQATQSDSEALARCQVAHGPSTAHRYEVETVVARLDLPRRIIGHGYVGPAGSNPRPSGYENLATRQGSGGACPEQGVRASGVRRVRLRTVE